MTAIDTPLTERPEFRTIGIVARKELRDAIRSKWFWLWAGAFGLLAAVIANIALPGSQVAEFGRDRAGQAIVAKVECKHIGQVAEFGWDWPG